MIGWIAYLIAAAVVVLYMVERSRRIELEVRVTALEVQAGKRWAP